MKLKFLLLVLAAAASAGCPSNSTNNPGAPAMSIQDITWQLDQVGGKSAAAVPADAKAAYLRLGATDQRVSGHSGVNQFSGSYEASGNSLKFGPAAMTRRAGPPELMQQETAFIQAMQNTTSWRAAGNDIELLDSGGKVLARLSRAGT